MRATAVLVGLAVVGCGRDRADPGAAVPPTIRRAPTLAPDAGPGRDGQATGDPGGGVAGGGAVGGGGIPAAPPASAVTCRDPLAGVWIAKTFATTTSRWHEHRLTITRDAAGYNASQTTHMWDGTADAPFPPGCPSGGWKWTTVDMVDEVELLEGVVHVWGTAVTGNRPACGAPDIGYNLDSFTGRLKGNTFGALNNDDNDARDRPYTFRRVACGT